MNQPGDIDAYILDFPPTVQALLQQVRQTIRNIVPEATEAIKYAIPTFVLKGKNLVHFAGYKNHIGFYPTPGGQSAFKEALSGYKMGKGSVQFPLDQAIPFDLIEQMVLFRVKEILEQSAQKK